MILEKIKENSGKLSFFAISVLLIIIGALALNQNNQSGLSNATAQQNSGIGSTGTTSVKNQTVTKTPSASTRVS